MKTLMIMLAVMFMAGCGSNEYRSAHSICLDSDLSVELSRLIPVDECFS